MTDQENLDRKEVEHDPEASECSIARSVGRGRVDLLASMYIHIYAFLVWIYIYIFLPIYIPTCGWAMHIYIYIYIV